MGVGVVHGTDLQVAACIHSQYASVSERTAFESSLRKRQSRRTTRLLKLVSNAATKCRYLPRQEERGSLKRDEKSSVLKR